MYLVVLLGRQVPLTGTLLGTRLIKYGVVSTRTLYDDLTNWKTLYLSGRMHKPVRTSSITADEWIQFGLHWTWKAHLCRW